MSFLDYFKSKRRLIKERDYAWDCIDTIRSTILATDSLEDLKALSRGQKVFDPVRVFNVDPNNPEELTIELAGIKCLAQSWVESFESVPDAANYITLYFTSPKTLEPFSITVQREEGLHRSEQIKQLKQEVKDLQEKLDGRQEEESSS